MQKVSDNLNKKASKSLDYLLDEEFDEALKDEEFKKFVSNLKLKRETLKKYTSNLLESFKDYKLSTSNHHYFDCPTKLKGYIYMPKIVDDMLEFSYVPCHCKKDFDKQNKYHDNTLLFDIPEEIKEASFKNIYKQDKNRYEVILWLTEFIKKYKKNKHQKGLYLYGNFGCGKTYLIAAMFNELAKSNIKSAIVFWPEYLRNLKDSFNSPVKSEFSQKYNYLKKVPLLLIDDIGAESTTPWSRDEILCPLLQYRMDEKLPTFFTSNLDSKNLETHLSITSSGIEEIKAGRIISRIKQLTEVKEMVSENLRK